MVNIWDPHFHIWDVSEVTQSGHDPAQLFAPKEDPVYTIEKDPTRDKGLRVKMGPFSVYNKDNVEAASK